MCYFNPSLIVNLMVKGCSVDFEWETNKTDYGVGTYRFEKYSWRDIEHLYGSQMHLKDNKLVGKGFSLSTGPVVFEKEYYDWKRRRAIKLKDHPEMCFEFAALEPLEQNILSFAKRYGLLGIPTSVIVPTEEEPGTAKPGEPFQLWMIEIIGLRVAVILWELVEDKNEDELRKYVHWYKGGPFLVNPAGSDDFKQFGDPANSLGTVIYYDEVPHLPQGDVLTPARHWLKEAINARLSAYMDVELAVSDTGSLVYSYQPKNLLGALWYQFSQFVTGVKRMNRCLVCDTPIVIEKGGRSDKVYCSDSHKVLANRAGTRVRKQKARA